MHGREFNYKYSGFAMKRLERKCIHVQESIEIPQKAHTVYPSLPGSGGGSAKLGYQCTHGVCAKNQLVPAFPSAK